MHTERADLAADGLPKAVLLDLDGTILDDTGMEACWLAVCAEAAERHRGVNADTLHAEVVRYRTWYWSDPARHREGRLDQRAASTAIVTTALANLDVHEPDLATSLGHRYRDLHDQRQRLLPGAADAIERLRTRGVRLALMTNGAADTQRQKIERVNLARISSAS